MAETILVVEDEPHIQEILEYNLSQEGYQVHLCADGLKALEMASRLNPQLILLDLMLPGISGVEICHDLRNLSTTANIPVIMLTARGTEEDKVRGLDVGADDYVTKPFSPKELVARIRAILRRGKERKAAQMLRVGKLAMNLETHHVRLAEVPVTLTLTEFKILKTFMTNGERVLSRTELTGNAQGTGVNVSDRTIDVHLAALRKKIGAEADRIETVRGVGYRFRST